MRQNNLANRPLVTVVMPTYNSVDYVGVAIQSVLDQTYRPIHLLIGDDASTDGTKEIIKSFAQQHPDIIEVIYNPYNFGIAGNVGSLYPHIKGKYVSWFAGDDLLYPEKISLQVNALQSDPEAIFSFHDVDVIDESGRFLFRYNDEVLGQKVWTKDIAKNLLLHRCFISGLSFTVNRENDNGIKHRFECGPCADWLLFFELAANGKAIYIDQPLGAYRRHSGNITRKAEIAWENAVYDYVATHYPAYKRYVEYGRQLLYQKYIFKYALRRQWINCFNTAGQFLRLLAIRPLNLFFVVKMLLIEIKKRVLFRIKTGRFTS